MPERGGEKVTEAVKTSLATKYQANHGGTGGGGEFHVCNSSLAGRKISKHKAYGLFWRFGEL